MVCLVVGFVICFIDSLSGYRSGRVPMRDDAESKTAVVRLTVFLMQNQDDPSTISTPYKYSAFAS